MTVSKEVGKSLHVFTSSCLSWRSCSNFSTFLRRDKVDSEASIIYVKDPAESEIIIFPVDREGVKVSPEGCEQWRPEWGQAI
jgi:hypothetical protein